MSGKIIRKCSWRTLRNTVENTIGNTVDELGDVSEINLGVADRSGQDRELKRYHICSLLADYFLSVIFLNDDSLQIWNGPHFMVFVFGQMF